MDVPTRIYRIDTPDGTSNFAFGTEQTIDDYRKNNPSHQVFSLVYGVNSGLGYFEPMEPLSETEE